ARPRGYHPHEQSRPHTDHRSLHDALPIFSRDQADADKTWLKEPYPQAQVISISAAKGEGLEDLAQILMNQKASLRRPDIGYGGRSGQHPSELQSRFELVCRPPRETKNRAA